ncbi:ribosome small subunit-dependent GTPase A [Pseudodesulfovibrio sp.]|uniref:ribosome small subunit-dependent GTPase A n=1 Tax=unclassified Pseudodesulfovibrio TaxID=2661612 RepID=UPI003B004528
MTNRMETPTYTSHETKQLHALGWNEDFDHAVADMGGHPGQIGRVLSVRRGRFLVTDGQEERLCAPAGRLLHGQGRDYPVTGDWVFFDDAVVTEVIPRKSLLTRGEAGSRGGRAGTAQREQAIAANLDMVFIVCGLDRDYNVRRLERYLTLVQNCALSAVVVLTKADLHADTTPFQLEAESIALGTPVIVTSMLDGRGKQEIKDLLPPGRTVAMIGSSGAGKSTLANMLHGSDIQPTGNVSQSVGKGRHTTTAREIILLPGGGLLMDNPGIREIAFHETGQGVDASFADIRQLAESCRFADCSHRNEPGCAVLAAVELGDLSPARLENYQKMKRELDFLSERSAKSADRVEKERWRGIAKRIKRINKDRP